MASSAGAPVRVPCPHRNSDGVAALPEETQGYQSITEGSATVLFRKGQVFYNQVQIFNRDLSVAVIRTWDEIRRESAKARDLKKAWGDRDFAGLAVGADKSTLPPLRILEALSASGLRSARYAKELPANRISLIVANDIEPAAVQAIQRNIAFNGLSPDRVVGNAGDAALVMQLTSRGLALPGMEWMHTHSGRREAALGVGAAAVAGAAGGEAAPTSGRPSAFSFDVVDLDPYGSASVFLDGAVQAVAEGGLLAVTCTDMAVLAGNHQDACRAKYGAVPVRGRHFSEQALRIVLGSIESAANKYKKSITPILSVQPDFYLRVFVTVRTSAQDTNAAPMKTGLLHQCSGCDAFWLWPLGKGADSGKGILKSRPTPNAHANAHAGAAPAHEGAEEQQQPRDEAADASACGSQTSQTWNPNPEDGGKAGRTGVKRKLLRGAFNAAKEQALQSNARSGGVGQIANANIAPEVPHCCPFCGRSIVVGGPVWLGPIHDPAAAKRVSAFMDEAYGADGRGGPAAKASSVSGAIDTSLACYDLSPALTIVRSASDGGSNDVDTVATSRRRLMGVVKNVVDEHVPAAALAAASSSCDGGVEAGTGAGLKGPLPHIASSPPLYYEVSTLCSRVKCTSIPLPSFMAALTHAGYVALPTHAGPNLVKTDAPPVVIMDILRAWAKQSGKEVGEGSPAAAQVAAVLASRAASSRASACTPADVIAGRTPAWAEALRSLPIHEAILAVERQSPPEFLLGPVNFDAASAGIVARRSGGASGPRYVPNPGANWGPKSRAVGIPNTVKGGEVESAAGGDAKRARVE